MRTVYASFKCKDNCIDVIITCTAANTLNGQAITAIILADNCGSRKLIYQLHHSLFENSHGRVHFLMEEHPCIGQVCSVPGVVTSLGAD